MFRVSAALAFAALLAGAGEVVGLDIDPRAVWVAREAARLQEAPRRPVLLVGGTAAVAGRFDVVLCNMVSGLLLPLLGELRRLTRGGGTLVLAGFLAAERARVLREIGAVGLEVTGERTLGEWLAVRARRG